ncbi:unnamed protein product, partial [Amoebophrya sp. A25]|eukprot:GSA25T00020659001.1
MNRALGENPGALPPAATTSSGTSAVLGLLGTTGGGLLLGGTGSTDDMTPSVRGLTPGAGTKPINTGSTDKDLIAPTSSSIAIRDGEQEAGKRTSPVLKAIEEHEVLTLPASALADDFRKEAPAPLVSSSTTTGESLPGLTALASLVDAPPDSIVLLDSGTGASATMISTTSSGTTKNCLADQSIPNGGTTISTVAPQALLLSEGSSPVVLGASNARAVCGLLDPEESSAVVIPTLPSSSHASSSTSGGAGGGLGGSNSSSSSSILPLNNTT